MERDKLIEKLKQDGFNVVLAEMIVDEYLINEKINKNMTIESFVILLNKQVKINENEKNIPG